MSKESPPPEKSEMQKLLLSMNRIDWTEASKREEDDIEEKEEAQDKEKIEKKNTKRRASHKSGHDGKAATSNKPKEKISKKESIGPYRVLVTTLPTVSTEELYFFFEGDRSVFGIKKITRPSKEFQGEWLISLANRMVLDKVEKKKKIRGATITIIEVGNH